MKIEKPTITMRENEQNESVRENRSVNGSSMRLRTRARVRKDAKNARCERENERGLHCERKEFEILTI